VSVLTEGHVIKIGIVGLGYWGPNLVRVFMEQGAGGQVRVTAAADANEARRQIIHAKYPALQLFNDAHALIKSDVDAVVVATPLAHHFPIALAALQAGKHVLVEKPLTPTSAEAETLIAEAHQRGLTLMVDHTFVYNPAVVRLREMIARGDLGELLYFDSQRINLGLFQPDTDVMWDLAVHDMAILDYLHGATPTSVSAIGVAHLAGHPENTAFITMQYPTKFIAHINVNWLSPVKIRQLLIGGSRRMVVYDDMAPGNKLRIYDAGAERLTEDDPQYLRRVEYRLGDMLAPYVSDAEPLATLAAHFIKCIQGKETPRSGGDAGLRIVRLLEAATESVRKNGLPISYEKRV
jgi:predicted dehydrogenase